MTDDIVTRLRESLQMIHPDPQDVRDAIKEIERLQAEIDTLSKVIRKLNGDGVIYFRDKAVRGE
jgi:prefoldin subunit 5